MPAAAIQRECELLPGALAERLCDHDRLQFGDHRVMTAACQLGVHQVFPPARSPLLQPPTLDRRPLTIGELAERCTTPQPERPAQVRHSRLGITVVSGSIRGGQEHIELGDVDVHRIRRDEHVTTRAEPDRQAPPKARRGRQRLAQSQHVTLQRLVRRPGRFVAPQRANQCRAFDGTARRDDQATQQRPRCRPEHHAVELDGAEHAQHQRATYGAPERHPNTRRDHSATGSRPSHLQRRR